MRISIAIFMYVFVTFNGYSQDFKVMFYNVENFFDTVDDPKTNDDSFTPAGANHWTKDRFNKKRNNIYKVIMAAGENRIPDIIGLCEIENRYVLKQLTEQTPLSKYDYEIEHYDSPDPRGIDVALLYRKKSFNVVASKKISVNKQTRDILYVKGYTDKKDTLHFFVNHWSSKWRGAVSEKTRINSAQYLKKFVDSLFKSDVKANICIMGDFNDFPDSKPVKVLDAKTENTGSGYLYNLSMRPYKNGEGSIVYRNKWELIDLFFVSGNLIFNKTGLNCSFDDYEIFKPDFVLETSGKNKNKFPKRTYKGTVYTGGFSDHLPVIISFKRK